MCKHKFDDAVNYDANLETHKEDPKVVPTETHLQSSKSNPTVFTLDISVPIVTSDHCHIIWLIWVVRFLKSKCPACLGGFKR